MTWNTWERAGWAALLLLVAKPAMAFPRYGNGSNLSALESSVTSQLHSVEKTMESAHKELTAARQQLTKTESEQQKQAHEYNALHQQVQKEADSRPEIVEARKQVAEAERDFHNERDRVLKQLKATASYQTASEQKQAVSAQLKSLAENDPQETRSALGKQLTELTATLSNLESAAITATPKAKQAQQRRHDAEQELAQLIRDRNNAVDKDSRLNFAKTGFDRARADHDAAKRQFAQAQAASTHADRAYQSLMQEKIMLDQQRSQQQRANRYGYGGRLSRRHYGVGPLGGAIRVVPPPTVIIH